MRPKPRQNLILDYLKKTKPIIIDYSTDYIEYDHITGEKIFHGKMKEAIKVRVPYLYCTNESKFQNRLTKAEKTVQATYYTVDGQSVSETIIDLDIIATANELDEFTMVSSKSILRPISDEYFDKLVESGKIQLEKPNIEIKTTYEQ